MDTGYSYSYGGGVLELEPTEAEDLPIPYFRCSTKNLVTIDKMIRDKPPNRSSSFYYRQNVAEGKIGND
jgi:hypothetical protein